jgi:hypothetical protein
MEDRVLLFWGDIGAGKTSLLATGLLGRVAYTRLDVVDWGLSLPSVQDGLMAQYRRLTTNLVTIPTTGIPPGVRVRLRGTDRAVLFQDMMGEHARHAERPEPRQLLEGAHAVLFVLAWSAGEWGRQFDAIAAALPAVGDRPSALAFTMCERVLEREHPAWLPGGEQTEWWADLADWNGHEETLRKFGAVWPTSSYGFSPAGDPACVLDEFGEMIPYNIDPMNCTRLLGWFLGRLAG